MKNVDTSIGQSRHSESGRTIIETLIVITIIGVLTAVTLPQVISARRLLRSAQLPREVVAQLRYTRQQAMAQRQTFTIQYNDVTKQITIFDHNNRTNTNAACNVTWATLAADAAFPNTTCTTTVATIPLTGKNGIPSGDLIFGVPSALTTPTLDDTTTPTALANNVINVTFQPDGTVVDVNGNPVNRALFFYNNRAQLQTASAISVLGAAGRIKLWRYDASANKYAE